MNPLNPALIGNPNGVIAPTLPTPTIPPQRSEVAAAGDGTDIIDKRKTEEADNLNTEPSKKKKTPEEDKAELMQE